MAKNKVEDIPAMYDVSKLKFFISDGMIKKITDFLNDKIGYNYDGIGDTFFLNCDYNETDGESNKNYIRKLELKLEKDDSDKYGYLFKIKISITTDRNDTTADITYLDKHDAAKEWSIGWNRTNEVLNSRNPQHSFLNGNHSGLTYSSSIFTGYAEPTKGVWFGLSAGSASIRKSLKLGNRFCGRSSGFGPYPTPPYIKLVNSNDKVLKIHDIITTDGDGSNYNSNAIVVKPNRSYILFNAYNHIDYIYYKFSKVEVDENTGNYKINLNSETELKSLNMIGLYNNSNGTYSNISPIGLFGRKEYDEGDCDEYSSPDSPNYNNGKNKIVKQKAQKLKLIIPDADSFRHDEYYVLTVIAKGFGGYSNILNSQIFRIRNVEPSITEKSVELNYNDPMRSIIITLKSDNKIYDVRIKVTAKTTSDGKPDWTGAKRLDIASTLNPEYDLVFNNELIEDGREIKTATATINLAKCGIKKNDGDHWYNNTYYVCAKIQAANIDYLWSKSNGNETYNVGESFNNNTDGYAYIGKIKTKNIATFDSFPNTMIVGQNKTPTADIKVSEGVKYRIKVKLPGEVNKLQPADITIARSAGEYGSDNPLTISVSGVNISTAEWDTIYKQFSDKISVMPNTPMQQLINSLNFTAEIISYYADDTKAGSKELSVDRTILLKDDKTKVRTVRVKNNNTVKAGMVYFRDGNKIKKGVVWAKNTSTDSSATSATANRGVINGKVTR